MVNKKLFISYGIKTVIMYYFTLLLTSQMKANRGWKYHRQGKVRLPILNNENIFGTMTMEMFCILLEPDTKFKKNIEPKRTWK